MTRADLLYELLPAIYRIRDAEQGNPLHALLGVIAEEINQLEDHIGQTYDNWFIETCEEWLVPYIGDLLGVRPLHPVSSAGVSLRAYVANTLAYRRRKGTAAVLEQLARDTTDWSARAVEFFQLLATTQHMNHVRLGSPGWTSLRDGNRLELVGGPFEQVPYNAEVRRIATRGGKYNIPNVGLFLWRLQAYPIEGGTPRPVADPPDGRYTFSPLGLDMPLFNPPQTEEEITHLAEEVNVPGALRRRPLYDELEARRQAIASRKTPVSNYFGEKPVIKIYLDAQTDPLPSEEILICNLDGWDKQGWTPPASKTFAPSKTTQVAVDPVLGRLCALQGISHQPDRVSYAYGFSGDLGGGPYNRSFVRRPDDPAPSAYENTVAVPGGLSKFYRVSATGFKTLSSALAQWQTDKSPHAVIQIDDSRTYNETLTIPMAATDLAIQAANGQRTTLIGDINITGKQQGRLTLNGLLMAGSIAVDDDSLRQLDVLHCTLVPGVSMAANGAPLHPATPSIVVGPTNKSLMLNIVRCITGPITLANTVPELRVLESIVDPEGGSKAIVAPGSRVQIDSSTLLGTTQAEIIEASTSIFQGTLSVTRRQTGCVRFSFLADNDYDKSGTPRRYRCQPDLEVAAQIEQAEKESWFQNLNESEKEAERKRIRSEVVAWLRPCFTSTQYGHQAYGQLGRSCPKQITAGAENGSEMGAFGFLMQPQRETNLYIALEEYLRFGLEAGLFYVT